MRNMTIVTLAAIAGLLVAGSASAGPIVADGFETSASPSATQYEADQNLRTQDPDIAGFDGAWGGPTYHRFSTRTTGISGFFTDEAAGGLEVDAAGSTDQTFTRTITADPAEDSKTYWFAFSANFATTTGGVSMGYSVAGDTVDFGMEDGQFTLVGKESGADDDNPNPRLNETFGTAEAGTDYLFITSVEIEHFDSGNNEPFNAWVFTKGDLADWDGDESTLSDYATATLDEEVTANVFYTDGADAGLNAARVLYHDGIPEDEADGTQLDEYRISSDFDGLSIVPEPATMSLLALGGLGALLKRKR